MYGTEKMILRQVTAVSLGFITGIIIIDLFLWVILVTPLWHILPVVKPIIVRPNTTSGTELIEGGVFIWPQENRVKVHINSYGLRDKELKTSVDSTRVVLTGDSIVEALQVNQNDTMDNKAEENLRNHGFNVEIANLGAAGHGPLRQLVRLEDIGLKLEPKIVISVATAGDFVSGELLKDVDHPGYVRTPDGELIRGETFKNSFSRRFVNQWQGQSFLTLLQFSNLFRATYSIYSQPVTHFFGLSRNSESTMKDICSTDYLTSLHRLWVDRFPQDNWDATAKFFDEYAERVRSVGAVPFYAMRQIPITPTTCQHEITLRSELINTVRQYLTEMDIGFIDWDLELLNSDTLTLTNTNDLSILHGFGTSLGHGHFNQLGHEASSEILSNIIISEMEVQP
jgi:hypothetical protein